MAKAKALTEATPITRAKKQTAHIAAVPEPSLAPTIPPAPAVPDEGNDEDRLTPRQKAKIGEMVALLTSGGQLSFTDVVREKLKLLSDGNHLYFTANDIAHKLLEPFSKSHSHLFTDDLIPFFRFSRQIGHMLGVLMQQKAISDSGKKVVRTDNRINAAFRETPARRTGYGFRWGLPVKAVEQPIPIAPPAPVPDHPDINPHPDGARNAESLQEMILSMNSEHCFECLTLLVSRLQDLQSSFMTTHCILLENRIADLRGTRK